MTCRWAADRCRHSPGDRTPRPRRGSSIPSSTVSGKYYLLARADADLAVAERDETNNLLSKQMALGADLVVSVLTAPGSLTRGTTVAVTVETKNAGGGAVAPSVTKVYLSSDFAVDGSDILLATIAVPVLDATTPADKLTTGAAIPPTAEIGLAYLIAVADADKTIPETKETNNQKFVVVSIR